jgi:hypothetical protein
MKTLSIRHPWIDAILLGVKTIEVRSTPTSHRGELLLHASATWNARQRELMQGLVAKGLELSEPDRSTLGAVVGRARLVDCRPMSAADWRAALVEPREGSFWAWELAEVTRLGPMRCRGHLGLFEVDDQVLTVGASP